LRSIMLLEQNVHPGRWAMLSFLDRRAELGRLRSLFARREPSVGVLYGRRRCGKSRLLLEALPPGRSVYHVADDRESPLQRTAVAKELAGLIPGFDGVTYPDWDALLGRAWSEAPPGSVLALDEFPALVAAAPELPSLLQKYIDRRARGPHLVLAGSSQRMMQGLVLDRTAPLFGRAREILRVTPLGCGWIRRALGLDDDRMAVEAFAMWGGVPRYWELAAEHGAADEALKVLVLDPLGVLHEEPRRLLMDDLREVAQASSILALIGGGSHRLSEIAARLGKPATSLSRPLDRLLELGLVRRDIPFGSSVRDTKRSLYGIADPFLRFWFRFVEPNRSRLAAGQAATVAREIRVTLPRHVAGVWEDLVRESIARRPLLGRTWGPARSWWGPGNDRNPMEIDVVAESVDGGALLLGEASWARDAHPGTLLQSLRRKAANFPLARGHALRLAVWTSTGGQSRGAGRVFGPAEVLRALH
jgi:AAA+ ATPase superfamily predicted ATPase